MLRGLSLDATGCLFRVRGSVGQHYLAAAELRGWRWPTPAPEREEQQSRLNRAFLVAWKQQSRLLPCFGAGHCSSAVWWSSLVSKCFAMAIALPREEKEMESSSAEGGNQSIGRCEEESLPCSAFPEDIGEELFESFRSEEMWELFPDALPCLETLKTAQVPIVVLSNFDERLEALLDALGVRQYFTSVLTSRALETEKPSRQAFSKAAEALSLPAANILHVGDHPTRDYAGAIAAGMQARLLTRSPEPTKIGEGTVTSLADIPALFR